MFFHCIDKMLDSYDLDLVFFDTLTVTSTVRHPSAPSPLAESFFFSAWRGIASIVLMLGTDLPRTYHDQSALL